VKDHYRHCKTILVLGASSALLDKLGVPPTLDTGEADPGLIFVGAGEEADGVLDTFVQAIARHRHFERETDPPRV